jgi:hypothetical protein
VRPGYPEVDLLNCALLPDPFAVVGLDIRLGPNHSEPQVLAFLVVKNDHFGVVLQVAEVDQLLQNDGFVLVELGHAIVLAKLLLNALAFLWVVEAFKQVLVLCALQFVFVVKLVEGAISHKLTVSLVVFQNQQVVTLHVLQDGEVIIADLKQHHAFLVEDQVLIVSENH